MTYLVSSSKSINVPIYDLIYKNENVTRLKPTEKSSVFSISIANKISITNHLRKRTRKSYLVFMQHNKWVRRVFSYRNLFKAIIIMPMNATDCNQCWQFIMLVSAYKMDFLLDIGSFSVPRDCLFGRLVFSLPSTKTFRSFVMFCGRQYLHLAPSVLSCACVCAPVCMGVCAWAHALMYVCLCKP